VDANKLITYLEELEQKIKLKKVHGYNVDFLTGKQALCVALLNQIKDGKFDKEAAV
jgi:hypothetical protein